MRLSLALLCCLAALVLIPTPVTSLGFLLAPFRWIHRGLAYKVDSAAKLFGLRRPPVHQDPLQPVEIPVVEVPEQPVLPPLPIDHLVHGPVIPLEPVAIENVPPGTVLFEPVPPPVYDVPLEPFRENQRQQSAVSASSGTRGRPVWHHRPKFIQGGFKPIIPPTYPTAPQPQDEVASHIDDTIPENQNNSQFQRRKGILEIEPAHENSSITVPSTTVPVVNSDSLSSTSDHSGLISEYRTSNPELSDDLVTTIVPPTTSYESPETTTIPEERTTLNREAETTTVPDEQIREQEDREPTTEVDSASKSFKPQWLINDEVLDDQATTSNNSVDEWAENSTYFVTTVGTGITTTQDTTTVSIPTQSEVPNTRVSKKMSVNTNQEANGHFDTSTTSPRSGKKASSETTTIRYRPQFLFASDLAQHLNSDYGLHNPVYSEGKRRRQMNYGRPLTQRIRRDLTSQSDLDVANGNSIQEKVRHGIQNFLLDILVRSERNSCIARTICLLSARPDDFGSLGRRVTEFFKDISPPYTHPICHDFKSASVIGSTLKSDKACFSVFSGCQFTSEKLTSSEGEEWNSYNNTAFKFLSSLQNRMG